MEKGKKIGLLEAISMAVGTMVGASIFSIFGVGAKFAGQNLPEAFILSGIFAFLVAYSYSKLGGKIVSNAGPIAYILKGIGDNVITGTLAVLMWLSFVVSISLFAKGFAGYFLPLAHISVSPLSIGMTEVLLIAFFTAINTFGSKAVVRVEFYIVLVKLSILGAFIVFGLLQIKPSLIVPSFDKTHLYGTLHASVMFFLSYMGFGLITNTSEHMENPKKNVPRAIFISIIVVLFIYVSVALVAVGNLSIPELLRAQENALAVAAKPFLGNFGFILISVGALFSIASALNATLYGGANVAYSFAKNGELPEFFERKTWFNATEGLYITAVLSLVFALLFDLGSIALLTSIIFTIIYIFVLISHYRLRDECGGNKFFILFNLVVLAAVLIILFVFQWQMSQKAFFGVVIVLLGAFSMEFGYRYIRKRKLASP